MKTQPKFALLGLAAAVLRGACRERTEDARVAASPAPADASSARAR